MTQPTNFITNQIEEKATFVMREVLNRYGIVIFGPDERCLNDKESLMWDGLCCASRAALEAVADDIRAQPQEIDDAAVDATAKAFVEFMGCADIFEGCLKINDEPCPCREVARAAIFAYEYARGK